MSTKPSVRKLNRYRMGHFPRMIRERSFLYMGFKVSIYNNKRYGMRYEWKLYPISQQAKHMCRDYYHKMVSVIHDPTSMPRRRPAIRYGKIAAYDLMHPRLSRR